MMAKEPRKHRIPIMLSDEELAALDDWQFANRISTRSNAIRRLIVLGISGPEREVRIMESLDGLETEEGCTRLYERVVNTEAWSSLDAYAQIVYFELLRRFNGKNNGAITASVRGLARDVNCSNRPIIKALRDLQDRGFIVAIQKGSFNWKMTTDRRTKNRASVWLLTEFPQDEPVKELTPRNDFLKWRAA